MRVQPRDELMPTVLPYISPLTSSNAPTVASSAVALRVNPPLAQDPHKSPAKIDQDPVQSFSQVKRYSFSQASIKPKEEAHSAASVFKAFVLMTLV